MCIHASRMPFGGVTVKDVDAHEFVKAFAGHLKSACFCVYIVKFERLRLHCKISVGVN